MHQHQQVWFQQVLHSMYKMWCTPKGSRLIDQPNTDWWMNNPHSHSLLICSSGPESWDWVTVFNSRRQVFQQLSNSHIWFMDSTFSVARHLFTQEYFIHAPTGTTAISCVYALVMGKQHSDEFYLSSFHICGTDICWLWVILHEPTTYVSHEMAASGSWFATPTHFCGLSSLPCNRIMPLQ